MREAVHYLRFLMCVLLVGQAATACERTPPRGPFNGIALYRDPNSQASRAATDLRRTAPQDAELLQRIANQPQAIWFGDDESSAVVTSAVSSTIAAASRTNTIPVLVAYNIPLRDCHSYSAGGASNADAYVAWIDAFAAGIGDARAVVILEPDALSQLNCLSLDDQTTRLWLLRIAVAKLRARSHASVYIDAGNSAWLPAGTMASMLNQVTIEDVQGFALNVAAFNRTADELAYGSAISKLVGNKHFVIDTSRNGLGPVSGPLSWCNPPGRALGSVPLTPTNAPLADAFLWIKAPGRSDGHCERNEPAAGTFWVSYALGLARRAL